MQSFDKPGSRQHEASNDRKASERSFSVGFALHHTPSQACLALRVAFDLSDLDESRPQTKLGLEIAIRAVSSKTRYISINADELL